MLRYWILDESGEPLETDLDTWSGLFANRQRIILQETVDGYFISTVFVGCNVRFETMVFRPDDDAVWQARNNTKAEALADHERALRAGDVSKTCVLRQSWSAVDLAMAKRSRQ